MTGHKCNCRDADADHNCTCAPSPSAEAAKPVADGYPLDARIWKRESTQEWVLSLSGTINDTCFDSRHTEPLTTAPEDVAGLPSLYAFSQGELREAGEALATQLAAVIDRLNGQAYSSTLSALNAFRAALAGRTAG